MIHAFAASRSRSTRRDGWVRKPPPATMGDYLLGGTALKQAPEHPTSASITSIKEKVLNLNDQTAFPAFGKSGGGEKSAGKPAAASKVAPRLAFCWLRLFIFSPNARCLLGRRKMSNYSVFSVYSGWPRVNCDGKKCECGPLCFFQFTRGPE